MDDESKVIINLFEEYYWRYHEVNPNNFSEYNDFIKRFSLRIDLSNVNDKVNYLHYLKKVE